MSWSLCTYRVVCHKRCMPSRVLVKYMMRPSADTHGSVSAPDEVSSMIRAGGENGSVALARVATYSSPSPLRLESK